MHKWLPNLVAKFWLPNLVLNQTAYKMANFHGVCLKLGHIDSAEFYRYWKVFFLLSQNLQVILRDSALLPLSWNMQFCNEQTRTQRLFSPACASATYGSPQVVADSNFKYVLEIKDVPKLKDIRT